MSCPPMADSSCALMSSARRSVLISDFWARCTSSALSSLFSAVRTVSSIVFTCFFMDFHCAVSSFSPMRLLTWISSLRLCAFSWARTTSSWSRSEPSRSTDLFASASCFSRVDNAPRIAFIFSRNSSFFDSAVSARLVSAKTSFCRCRASLTSFAATEVFGRPLAFACPLRSGLPSRSISSAALLSAVGSRRESSGKPPSSSSSASHELPIPPSPRMLPGYIGRRCVRPAFEAGRQAPRSPRR
mmetsp:Transcript_27740/g.71385  ORF Transcript_27740/g.71385 Transcript_27740/m.71385 type:complete len:243 (+) Transcript_27740:1841-2569(+)